MSVLPPPGPSKLDLCQARMTEERVARLWRDVHEALAKARVDVSASGALLAEAREALTRGLALHDDVEGWTRTLAP